MYETETAYLALLKDSKSKWFFMLELCATHACLFVFLYFIKLNIYFSILYLFVRILWVRVRVQVEVRREQPLRESISCDIQFAIRQNQSYSGSIYFKLWYSMCQTNISLWHIWIPQFLPFHRHLTASSFNMTSTFHF